MPLFDDSLAELTAHREEIGGCVAVAWGGAALLVRLLRCRARRAWARVPSQVTAPASPYRGGIVRLESQRAIPPLVRFAALSCFAFGNLFAPGIVAALVGLHFDGIAVPLIPGGALALAVWATGALLLLRARAAREVGRAVAISSLLLNVSLLAMSAVHLSMVEAVLPADHVCSSSFAFVSLVFAGAAVLQALLVLAAIRALPPADPAAQSAPMTTPCRP